MDNEKKYTKKQMLLFAESCMMECLCNEEKDIPEITFLDICKIQAILKRYDNILSKKTVKL